MARSGCRSLTRSRRKKTEQRTALSADIVQYSTNGATGSVLERLARGWREVMRRRSASLGTHPQYGSAVFVCETSIVNLNLTVHDDVRHALGK